jgi:hypothetical protein
MWQSKYFMKATAAGARVKPFTEDMERIIDQKIAGG